MANFLRNHINVYIYKIIHSANIDIFYNTSVNFYRKIKS